MSAPRHRAGEVVVLTGPPGAGKTTVARLVAERLPRSVHLHADDFWHAIRGGLIAPYLPEAHEQNCVVMNVLAQAAFGYAAGGYLVILDGVVGPWFVAPFRAASRAEKLALHYVVLRPDEATTLRRATARAGSGGGALNDRKAVRELHRQFADLGILEPHALDSGAQSPEQTALQVLREIRGGERLLGPRPAPDPGREPAHPGREPAHPGREPVPGQATRKE